MYFDKGDKIVLIGWEKHPGWLQYRPECTDRQISIVEGVETSPHQNYASNTQWISTIVFGGSYSFGIDYDTGKFSPGVYPYTTQRILE